MNIPEDLITDFTAKAGKLLEGSGQDLKNNMSSLLQSLIGRLDLVSREDFEIQQKVLMKTREKVEQLNKQVEQLEQRLNHP
ncbi:accessory factor UbiK family protein [Gynuella sunshinyii]|uniref:Ubiquinone biosynthesis accessory factor UbiK n=1 Tax=Gynuella sunshinyii YC6258 TaxID=1445510 RepID=A0A0C5UY63_9GAMM|nr:accessory factor UbiK family protein [Gynuella sunshinyii]AJQ92220.1 hypothetical protein YC6258_00168 [Gynuella sunshinyii YC6258]